MTEVFLRLLKECDASAEDVQNVTLDTLSRKNMTNTTKAFLCEDKNEENYEHDKIADQTKKSFKEIFFFLNSLGSSICGYSRFNNSKRRNCLSG